MNTFNIVRVVLRCGLFAPLLVAVALSASVKVDHAVGQDLLPADNGLVDYHKSPRWRESESHPLRVFAYVLHPIGWGLRELIFRPFSFFAGSSEEHRSVLGFREPFYWRSGICDTRGDTIPDCRSVAPWNTFGVNSGGLPSDDKQNDEASLSDYSSKQVCIPDVAFDFGKSSLTPLGKGRVRQVAQLLSSEPSLDVTVEGNADYVGSDTYNQKLGERRAQVVIKELEILGIDPKRLVASSRGELAPVFTEEEDWARAVNRRVRFQIKVATPARVSEAS